MIPNPWDWVLSKMSSSDPKDDDSTTTTTTHPHSQHPSSSLLSILPPKPAFTAAPPLDPGKSSHAAPMRTGPTSSVTALREAARLSLAKKAAPPKRKEREEGEISDEEEGQVVEETAPRSKGKGRARNGPTRDHEPHYKAQASGSRQHTQQQPAGSGSSRSTPQALDAGIKRSTVVTIKNSTPILPPSPGGKNMTPQDEEGYLDLIRSYIREGFKPDALIRNGAPEHIVTRVCEELVAGANATSGPTRSVSPSPQLPRLAQPGSPGSDVEVAVKGDSDSEAEATIENMIPPSPPAKIVPSSSWAPGPSRTTAVASAPARGQQASTSAQAAAAPAPIHLESYRPTTRPAAQHGRRRGRRDLDRADASGDTLNYGDEEDSAPIALPPPPPRRLPPAADDDRPAPKSAPVTRNPSPPPPPPATAPPPPPTTAPPPPPPVPPVIDLAETRRRALESMRKRKTATPASGVSTPTTAPNVDGQTPAAQISKATAGAAATPEPTTATAAEEAMDLDDSAEEGEIEDKPVVAPPPPPARGRKRPAAEDLMDNRSRPLTTMRFTYTNKRLFCPIPQDTDRLQLSLDDDSEDSEDEEPSSAPFTAPPVIVIPPPYDLASLKLAEKSLRLAEKEAEIRRLKEQIQERLRLKQASTPSGSTPNGSSTPTDASRVAAAVAAAVRVGAVGMKADVVEAAVEAVAEEQKAVDDDAAAAKATRHSKANGRKGKAKAAVDPEAATSVRATRSQKASSTTDGPKHQDDDVEMEQRRLLQHLPYRQRRLSDLTNHCCRITLN
ncbi:uncharacterized protein LOC62_07G009552 [Vanrija pseudolonga]|uniref:Uncharacterized protein n=1 Tax=Vanrija pseudolonga TaxID=143232 RepID=A0AAF1BUH1_9TREE|nr:hypothetical protein LOC62_07G009552 [Vanrija pseudolonga]WOO86068.1 hypothetical protein LOC62_07G009552 [Vanrija pseudolonga]